MRGSTVRDDEGVSEHDAAFRSAPVCNHRADRIMVDEIQFRPDTSVLALRLAATYPAMLAAEAHWRRDADGAWGRIVVEP